MRYVIFVVILILRNTICFVFSGIQLDDENTVGNCQPMKSDSALNIENSFNIKSNEHIVLYSIDKNVTTRMKHFPIPVAYTMSNEALGVGLVKGKPKPEVWLRNRVHLNDISDDHPRNNRSFCLDVTRQSAMFPLPLYNPFWNKEVHDEYIYYVHSGIINDVGAILVAPFDGGKATSSNSNARGAHSPSTTCVLSSRSGCEKLNPKASMKWTKKCTVDLRNVNLSWKDLFSSETSSLQRMLENMFLKPYQTYLKNMKTQVKVGRDAANPNPDPDAVVDIANGDTKGNSVPTILEFIKKWGKPLCGLNMTQLYIQLNSRITNIALSIPPPISASSITASLTSAENTHKPLINAQPVVHESVFVLTTLWDHNYHHFLIDGLVKLIPYISFLKRHPEMFIHIRRYEQFCKRERYIRGGLSMRERLWTYFGLVNPIATSSIYVLNDTVSGRNNYDLSPSMAYPNISVSKGQQDYSMGPTHAHGHGTMERIVSGGILAKHIYLPRSTECGWVVGSSEKVQLLANFMLWKSYLEYYDQHRARIDTIAPLEYKQIDEVRTEIKSAKRVIFNQGDSLVLIYDLIPYYYSKTYSFYKYYRHLITIKTRKSEFVLGLNSEHNDATTKVNKILLQIRHCQEKKTCQNDWREWPASVIDHTVNTMNSVLSSTNVLFARRKHTSTETNTGYSNLNQEGASAKKNKIARFSGIEFLVCGVLQMQFILCDVLGDILLCCHVLEYRTNIIYTEKPLV